METTKKTWLEQYKENYAGISPQAKSLEPFLKYNFKGNAYLPWAVMERLMYEQDPDAEITKLFSSEGGDSLVHSSKTVIETEVEGKRTVVQSFAHFVCIGVKFLGKEFEEMYPLQDARYEAQKTYDQNIVNKALQRATAKCIARATGLGLSLYEKGELQFDESPESEKKPAIKTTSDALQKLDKMKASKPAQPQTVTLELKPEQVATTSTLELKPEQMTMPSIDEATLINEPDEQDVIGDIINIIKDETLSEKVKNVLRSFNPSFVKNYQFTITPQDAEDELRTKLMKLADPEKFLKSIRSMTQ